MTSSSVGYPVKIEICYLTQKKFYQGSSTTGQLLKTETTDYGAPLNLPLHVTTTWNQQNLVSRVETDWDSYTGWGSSQVSAQNPVERREYAFGSGTWGSLARSTHFNYLHLTNSTYRTLNINDKVTSKKIYTGSSSTGTLTAQTQYTYDGVTTIATSAAPNHDYTGFGTSNNIRGNLTQEQKGLNVSGTWTWLNTNNTYNDLGELLTSTDPLNHQTSYDYTDSWATITNPQCVGSTNSYAFPTTITDALSHRTKHTYYSCTSLTASTLDENDIVAARAGTTYSFDLVNRPLITSRPDGGQTTFSYVDSAPISISQTDLIQSSPSILNQLHTYLFDGLGRLSQAQSKDPDCGGGSGLVKVDHFYGYNTTGTTGAFEQVSTPYCNSPDATYGLLTTTNQDALGRPISIVQTDTSTISTSYGGTTSGLTATVTEEAGKQRKSVTDALGRLTAVFEDPASLNYETDYTYDVLDDLTGVTQKGGSTSGNWRNRTFQYDSLGRLSSATNPESGTITYTYDNDSNLQTKVSPYPNKIPGDTSQPQTQTTTYSYDQVHRLYQKTYTDGTAAAKYGYDGVAGLSGCTPAFTPSEAIGRRTSMCDGSGSTTWDYFILGRTKKEQRTIGTVTKATSYTYNLDGSLGSITYPSTHLFTFTLKSAGTCGNGSCTASRPASGVSGTTNFVTSAAYDPAGALTSMINGYTGTYAGITTSNAYNKRMQPSTLSASDSHGTIFSLSYDFHLANGDNGNVWQIVNNRDNNRTQNFTYDSLNRIASAYTTSNLWGDNYAIDPWGNLYQKNLITGKLTGEALTQTMLTNNQFSGFCYDKAGNLLSDAGSCPASPPYTPRYSYDAENRLISIAGVTYTYDGDGKRVKKSNGTLYWTGMGDDPLAESDLSGNMQREYVFFNGKRTARWDLGNNSYHYYYSDHLGSADVVASVVSNAAQIEDESDYYPWGGERVISNSVPQNYKFTGKERDSETCGGSTLCVDYFGARHYSSALGRFMTPDWSEKPVGVPYANFGNPQSLNLYSYVNNNPTTTRDPDGHGLIDVQSLVNSAISWLSSSHSASASVGVDAGHSVDKAGPVTITSKALYADASGSASYASSGVKVSAQAGVGVVSEKATEGSIGTTSIKATSADAEAHAGVSLTGASAGAGANADVLSATQTVKLGVVTLSATGNVGIGAEASASASTTGLSASAGITPGFGGAVSVSVNFGQGSVSGGASAQSTNTGTGIKTTVDKPQVK